MSRLPRLSMVTRLPTRLNPIWGAGRQGAGRVDGREARGKRKPSAMLIANQGCVQQHAGPGVAAAPAGCTLPCLSLLPPLLQQHLWYPRDWVGAVDDGPGVWHRLVVFFSKRVVAHLHTAKPTTRAQRQGGKSVSRTPEGPSGRCAASTRQAAADSALDSSGIEHPPEGSQRCRS